jgi:NAD(P)-dependent dehydrogenase (short-subunit alcohol dehydrogenase family)
MTAAPATPPPAPGAGRLFDLSGRVAIVTGGARGIGLEMATGLAEAGAGLVLCGRDGERCEAVAAELGRRGAVATGVRCDVSQPDEVQRLVDHALERFGRIDVLVNNSGTTWGAPAEEHPLDGWQKVIGVNLTGAFLCAQAVGRVMLDRGSGKIVNVASVAGLRGSRPEIRQTPSYSASKGGLLALTRDLACEWGRRGVTVNALAPGWFPTAMAEHVLARSEADLLDAIPLGRFGSPDDLKGAIVFMASDASNYMTGQVLVLDGGRTAW